MFEKSNDIDMAIKSGAINPEALACNRCAQCGKTIGYDRDAYKYFVLIIDENDQDWCLCQDCASPMLDYVDSFFPPVTRSHFSKNPYEDEDLELF